MLLFDWFHSICHLALFDNENYDDVLVMTFPYPTVRQGDHASTISPLGIKLLDRRQIRSNICHRERQLRGTVIHADPR